MEKLDLKGAVDSHVSAYQVAQGRPYPYMIFKNMEIANVMDVARVAKAGDSARDIEEGRNAGCGLVIGVLSGADTAEQLLAAGADVIVDNVTQLGA
jgi:phosphoglycolate phosphatase-like HAD superfamily hydrolase